MRFAKLMKALLVAEEKEDWDNIRHVLSTKRNRGTYANEYRYEISQRPRAFRQPHAEQLLTEASLGVSAVLSNK